jgi:hypothetical protein
VPLEAEVTKSLRKFLPPLEESILVGEVEFSPAVMLNMLLPSNYKRTSGAVYPGVPHLVNVRS